MAEVKANDILWEMRGIRQNNNIHWKAIPQIVEAVEKYMYRFYSGGGVSHNAVGSMFFTTKEECEKHWLERHESFDEPIGFDEPTPEGMGEQPRTDWETYEVSKFDGVDSCGVYVGGLNRLVQITNELEWHKDTEHVAEYGMEVEYLELHEISEQIKTSSLLTVIVNSPMRSKVFQYGNYPDAGWVYLGEVQGYA